MKKTFLVLAGLALLTAVGVQALVLLYPTPEPSVTQPLADLISRDLPGWVSKDHPLGNTETLDERSHDLLKLDDFVFREFSRGDDQFFVYVAYWQPGKMPVRQVNSHTPDRCWTWSGWKCTDMRFSERKPIRDGFLKPFEWRVFEREGYRNYVIYWHIVGGRVHVYRQGFNENPPPTMMLHDLAKYGFNQRREQFFIRINSQRPIERLWNDPGFQRILSELAALCLADTDPEATASL